MPQPQPGDPASKLGKAGNGSPAPSSSPGSKSKSTENHEPTANADPIAMLSADHRKVEKLFADFEKATASEQKAQLAEQICLELVVHTLLEEEIFYPACQGHMEQRLLDEAQVEHDGAKALIIEIQNSTPDDAYFDAKVKVLSEDIKHHVREEEKPGEGIFAKAKEADLATSEIAERLATRKQELMQEAQADALGPPTTLSFRVENHAGRATRLKETQMARGSSATMERERDDRGRFISDDDDDRDYRRRSSSQRRYDDDDDDRRRSSSQRRYDDDDDDRRYARPRDDEGRFMSTRSRSRYDDDDDDRRYSRPRDDEGRFVSTRSRSRYDDDDDYRRGGRGHGGWFGDSEEHSRASREGWDDRSRGGTRSRYDDDDDRRYSRARDDEGRFTSTRSRSRYDDDDDRGRGRGHGGWYGDPEGHAEAARNRRR